MIGILGGTFDPIHFGHLRPALELQERFALDELRFIPARIPPHRDAPVASAEQRFRMVQLALRDQPGLKADDRELRRHAASYTVDTLADLRAERGADVAICLVLGSDAFAGLAAWRRWREIPGLAHMIVAGRPGADLPAEGELARLLARARVTEPRELGSRPHGGIVISPVTQLDISATRIREAIAAGRSARYLLPDAVWAYIQQQGLYGPGRSASLEY